MAVNKPTKTYTWATAGTATAPSGGKQAAGWAVAEMPPSLTVNWLYQANGEWLNYLDYVVYDAGTVTDTTPQVGPGIYLGEFRDAAIFLSKSSIVGDYAIVRMLSDNYSDLILQPDILRASEVQVGDPDDADTGGSLIVSPTTRATPASIIRHVDRSSPEDVCVFESGAFSPLSTAALVGATVPLDTVITSENTIKAFAKLRFTRVSAGVPTITEVETYNVTTASGTNNTLNIAFTDYSSATPGYSLSVCASGAVGDPVFSTAVFLPSLSWATGTFSVDLLASNAGVWDELGDTATAQSVIVTLIVI